ncbi:MAG: hypothetical protein ABIP27_16565 [Flavobacterium circumlabens]|uniref:hypothetical protein n=1 Tax=Flavobacterium circumlabens TaxID=2133765 RepID=UPI003264F6A8
MNNSKFVQTEGYPLTAQRLQELQTTFQIFQSFGSLAGELTIISGCEVIGTTIQNGTIVINGEPLEFREAAVLEDSTVIIYEEKVFKPFKNGTVKEVYAYRYASIGTAETSWPWASFKKLDPIAVLMARMSILEKKAAVFQAGGGMVLWNKPAIEIPDGWQEVEYWRGRMPVGFHPDQPEFNLLGKMEGARRKTLSEAELPVISPINGTGFKKGGVGGGTTGLTVNDYDSGDFAAGELIEPFGGGESFSILNPYRVVLFIEYIG